MTIQSKINEMFKKKEVIVSRPKAERSIEGFSPVEKEPVHSHKWKIIGKTYAPPTNVNLTGSQMAPESMEKALFGITTLLWECEFCGETKREEMLGSDEDLLEALVDKADKIGPQFIDRRGKTFIISEWKTPAQSQGMIPLK